MAEGYLKIVMLLFLGVFGPEYGGIIAKVLISSYGVGSPCRTACGLLLCPVLKCCPTGLKMQLLFASLNDQVRETQDFCPHTKINLPFSNNLCETG